MEKGALELVNENGTIYDSNIIEMNWNFVV